MNATIDETIAHVEELFTTLTGKPPLQTSRIPIPPEAEPLAHVQEQLGRMLLLAERVAPRETPAWSPHASMSNDDEGVVLELDVPGVSPSDVQIRVGPHVLVVGGRRRTPQRLVHSDARHGVFERSFRLVTQVRQDQVSARLRDGVLTIRIHKTRANDSQIPIMS